jgi:hypothetical protein
MAILAVAGTARAKIQPKTDLTVQDVVGHQDFGLAAKPVKARSSGSYDAVGLAKIVLALGLWTFVATCKWRLFQKAGQPGWAAIVPLYNRYVTLKLTGKPTWWLVMFLIPGINILFIILTTLALRRAFVLRDAELASRMPRLSQLAFGDSQYRGDGWWNQEAVRKAA